MAEIERGELLDCLIPFALYYELNIKGTPLADMPGNTPVSPATTFNLSDFADAWTVMQNDSEAKPIFDAILRSHGQRQNKKAPAL